MAFAAPAYMAMVGAQHPEKEDKKKETNGAVSAAWAQKKLVTSVQEPLLPR